MKNTLSLFTKPLELPSGSLEFLKWLALLSMTVDHANRFLFQGASNAAFCFGRLAMPLFAFVLAYNLARIPVINGHKYYSILKRLIIFGLLAMPPFMAMKHLSYPYPFNILFTLALSTASIYFFKKEGPLNRVIAIFIFLIGGFYVEYQWIGIFFSIAAWFYCERNSLSSLIILGLAYLLLDSLNQNHWALLSILLIALGSQIDFRVPRIKHFFYYFYPLHLYLLYFLSLMRT